MHRLLLYTLVVVLLCLAWSARRDEVLASQGFAEPRGGAAAGSGDSPEASSEASPSIAAQYSPRFGRWLTAEAHARLEARVEPRPDLWTALELAAASSSSEDLGGPGDLRGLVGPGMAQAPGASPSAESVLADAEQWIEGQFPEGGATVAGQDDLSPEADSELAAAAEMELELAALGRPEFGSPGLGTLPGTQEHPLDSERPLPITLEALARIESLDPFGGEVPAWCGLLDLALSPQGPADSRGPSFDPRPELGEGGTAWIIDERGRLVARVDELHGVGLELDPSWPWAARPRRLYWNQSGLGRLPSQQFRLVLTGNGLAPSWTGRIIFLPSSHSRSTATGR